MPTYTYRREDGTTFEIRQKFADDPLEVDPETGQSVERIISNPTGIIFKGSGFYVTDNRGKARRSASTPENNDSSNGSDASASSESSSSSNGSKGSDSSASSNGSGDVKAS